MKGGVDLLRPDPYGLNLLDQSYVSFGDPDKLDLSSFTIEAWFMRTGAGTPHSTGRDGIPAAIPLVAHGAPEADGSPVDANWILALDDSTGVIAADFEDMVTGANHPVYGITPVTWNVWHHAAASYNGSTWRLYLDGQLEAVLLVDAAPRSDTVQNVGLGAMIRSGGKPVGHFQGVLDEVRIWSIPRTHARIKKDINKQIFSGTGLVSRWGFGEGRSSIVGDSIWSPYPADGVIDGPGYEWIPGAPFDLEIDTIPPSAPTGLVAAPGRGFVALEWTSGSEPDLIGYNVYRTLYSPVNKSKKLNKAWISSPGFIDANVALGTIYYYAIAAVDRSGNESILSEEVFAMAQGFPDSYGLQFSGKSYVSFGDPDKLDLSSFTIEAWFMRTGAGTPHSTGRDGIPAAIPLVAHGAPEADGSPVDANWILALDDSTGVIAADFEDMVTGANHPVYGITPVTWNVWHHAAASYNGSTWRLYLDGQLEAVHEVLAAPRSDSIQKVGLGAMIRSNGEAADGRFQGLLDEVRVWDYARSEAEILNTINSQVIAGEAGLVARWSFWEGAGLWVGDSVSLAANGVIKGDGFTWVSGAPFDAPVNLPPRTPQLVAPLDAGTDVALPATLSVSISDPEGSPLDVSFFGRSLSADALADFSIVIIPDAQYYASTFHHIYTAQMQWISDHRESDNIVYVAGLGDAVEDPSDFAQWDVASSAYNILDEAGIPYGLACGNHEGAPLATENFNIVFGEDRFVGRPYYAGHYGADNDNHYDLFEASGLKFIVVFIEYDDLMVASDHPVLVWANGLLKSHSDRRGIVISHSVLQGGTSNEFTSQGQAIYDSLKGNSNLFLIMGGHLDIAARRTDTYEGQVVYTLRSDYQFQDRKQSGYLRILRFSPSDDRIYVSTYSPSKDIFYPDQTNNNFSLEYDLGGPNVKRVGTATGVPSGETASVSWKGLSPGMAYEWKVIVSDGVSVVESGWWSFTTASAKAGVGVDGIHPILSSSVVLKRRCSSRR
jgi:hypothetical protein